MRKATRKGTASKSPASQRNATSKSASSGRSKRSRAALDEELDSGDSGDEEAAQHAALLADEAENDAVEEPAEERRVRLAKEMIAAMDAAAARRRDGGADASGVVRGAHADAVAEELEEDALRRAGQWRCLVASKLRATEVDYAQTRVFRGPRLSATCVAIAPDESFVACGCKDGAILTWDTATGARTKLTSGRGTLHDAIHADGRGVQSGHHSDVLSVAISADSRLIVSGGRDSAVRGLYSPVCMIACSVRVVSKPQAHASSAYVSVPAVCHRFCYGMCAADLSHTNFEATVGQWLRWHVAGMQTPRNSTRALMIARPGYGISISAVTWRLYTATRRQSLRLTRCVMGR